MSASESNEPTRLDLLSVGEVLMDFIAPDAAELEHAREFLCLPGGAPANVAVASARLKGRVAFVGTVGNDPFGAALRRVLQEENVDVEGLRTVSQATTLAFVARNIGGTPDFVFYRGADAELRTDDISVQMIARACFLYVSSMALLSAPARDATLYAVEMAREAETLVAFDPNLRLRSWPSLEGARAAILSMVREADVVKLNDDEAKLLADTGDLDTAMAHLSAEKRLLVVTLGAKGCGWRLGEASGSVGSPQIVVRDTTGAGDAFMGALLTQLAAEGFSPTLSGSLDVANLESALSFACAAGAFSCTQPGAMASLPTREQVEELLASGS